MCVCIEREWGVIELNNRRPLFTNNEICLYSWTLNAAISYLNKIEQYFSSSSGSGNSSSIFHIEITVKSFLNVCYIP